jgi:iron complex outermembrane recepter protein
MCWNSAALRLNIAPDLDLLFHTASLGPRINQVDTSAWRAVLGADGVLAGWNYAAALTYSRNDQSDSLGSGYVSLARLNEAMATGLVNPFGPSGPEGDALLAATQVSGKIHSASGTTVDFLAKGSRETVALPGGPLALAVGAEALKRAAFERARGSPRRCSHGTLASRSRIPTVCQRSCSRRSAW